MKELYETFYKEIALQPVGIVLGITLIVTHIWALLKHDQLAPKLRDFPRNKVAGIVLIVLGAIWSFFLISEMDLGEFYTIRGYVKIIIPVGTFLVIQFVDEFLAVRALGVLGMLAAGPVLQAAFLEPPLTRLLLPILGYIWIIGGMFLVGMPYLLRDWIDWLTEEKTERWEKACYGGAGYGFLMLLCAVAFWG